MDDSTLSKILNGKRALGKNAMRRLGTKLSVPPDTLENFTRQIRKTHSKADAEYQLLISDSFQVIADWYHYAILELIRVENFEPNPRWIAKVLGITINEVNIAKERLLRLGLLEVRPDGRWIDPGNSLTTNAGPDVQASAHRRLQRQILEKAIGVLDSVPIEKRSQSAMTMAIDVDRIPEAKERIKKFRRGMAKFLSRGKKRDEVYNLSISLYPVSAIEERR